MLKYVVWSDVLSRIVVVRIFCFVDMMIVIIEFIFGRMNLLFKFEGWMNRSRC